MINHPRARKNPTTKDFIYVQGTRAVLGGLLWQLKHYEEVNDFESYYEVRENINIIKSEFLTYKEAVIRSDKYHDKRNRL